MTKKKKKRQRANIRNNTGAGCVGHTSIIPALSRLRQEDQKSEAGLGYIVIPRLKTMLKNLSYETITRKY
jgi:hypothetical protein